jgi:3-oxoacyl-(acyl-carrier-protein) synthase
MWADASTSKASQTRANHRICLSAAGVVELIATVLQMQRGIVHPTINQEQPDPDLDLDFVPNHAREPRIDVAISNSFGVGGLNSCVVVGRLP